MEAYIYKADLLCEECGADVRRDLNAEAVAALRGTLQDTCRDIPDPDTYESDSEEWARKHPRTLAKALGFDPEDEYAYDSDNYPKGPLADGGGESDSPAHCGECGVFLDNPLTQDGYEYVATALIDFACYGSGDPEVLQTWLGRYQERLDNAEIGDIMLETIRAKFANARDASHDHKPTLAEIGDLIMAAETLAVHASETYPHFESPRGQEDIARVRSAIEAVRAGR